MKRVLVFITLMAGLLILPATAAERGNIVTIEAKTSTYSGKKDDAYWTRVWYRKQAKKGRHYKRHVYNSKRYKKRRKYSKRSSVRTKKKRRRVAKRASSKNLRPGRGSGVVARVSLSRQRMNVYHNGVLRYTWKVSTGRSGYGTPRGSWRIHRMHKRYFSRKYDNAPMPHAMFYYGGFAVHGTNSIKRLGRRASHGCVRLHPSNAATLFAMVRRSGGVVKVVN